MFENKNFDVYSFKEIPLNRDIFVVDEAFIEDYEKMMVAFFDGAEYEYIDYVSFVTARKVNEQSLDLSWYANTTDRFHEISISLPKDQFVTCVGCHSCDERPRIFVKSSWIKSIYLRNYSVFALIDAIGVKNALQRGGVTRDKLIELRKQIDLLAKRYTNVSFISFADSLLLKSNWYVGYFKSGVEYSYKPEIFFHLVREIKSIYESILGLSVYAVITQGNNEYYDDALLHISETNNHISLNSLGIPFAQLMEIDIAVRNAIQRNIHGPADLYLEERYYHSLNFKLKYAMRKHDCPHNKYQTKIISGSSLYYYSSIENILLNLDDAKK